MALSAAIEAAYSKLWNFIQSVAPVRSATGAYAYQSSDIWSAASQIAREAGQSLTALENRGVPGLISLARSQANAIDALNSAPPGAAIDASMIATWPTAASLDVQAAQPQFMAKAQFTYTNNVGEQVQSWITVTNITELPQSADALALRLTGAAISAFTAPQSEGGKYLPADQMASFVSLNQFQLYAV